MADSRVRNAVEYVQIRDESGAIYRLKVGDFMGEKTGYIEQYLGKELPPRTVTFKKD